MPEIIPHKYLVNCLAKAKETLKVQKAELEAQLRASRNAVTNVPQIEGFIRTMQNRLSNLDFDIKRLASHALDITVWLDGQDVEITGAIPISDGVIATTQSSQHSHNTPRLLPFRVTV